MCVAALFNETRSLGGKSPEPGIPQGDEAVHFNQMPSYYQHVLQRHYPDFVGLPLSGGCGIPYVPVYFSSWESHIFKWPCLLQPLVHRVI